MPRPNYGVSYTKTFHRKPYPAIDPTQPSLSASGKTILITAGHTGIGYAIAQNFAIAGASNVIILARRADVLGKALRELSTENPKTKFHSYAASIDDSSRIKEIFREIRTNIAEVDVLVTSAAYVASFSDVLDLPVEQLRGSFETNVFGNINLVKEFLGDISKLSQDREKIVLDISSCGAHLASPKFGTYSTTKIAFSRWLELLHDDIKGKPLRIHSLHPGGVLTDAVRAFGITEYSQPWDDVQLPGQFAVWLASKEGTFLDGKFVWANWDVEELKEMKSQLENDPALLTLGLISD